MSVRIPQTVSIRDLARLLEVNERTVRRWQNPSDDKSDDAPRKAIPFTKSGNATKFPLKACIAWFVDYRASTASRSVSELDVVRHRKVTADAELAELQLAKERGQTVRVDSYRQAVREIATKIRAQLLAAPGRYSARIVGMTTLPEAQRALDAVVRDVLNELKEA